MRELPLQLQLLAFARRACNVPLDHAARDAVADRDTELHDDSVERIFPRLGETGTTAETRALLRPVVTQATPPAGSRPRAGRRRPSRVCAGPAFEPAEQCCDDRRDLSPVRL